jgi:hypothetical protein
VNKKFGDSLGVREGDFIYMQMLFTYQMNNILLKYDKYARANGKRRVLYRSNKN